MRVMAGLRRRHRHAWASLVIGIGVCSVTVAATPPAKPPSRAPSDLERQIASEDARAGDLKRRLDDVTARLRSPRPPVTDPVAAARADDLATQLSRAEERLAAPRPPERDGSALARAEDLSRQVARMSEQLSWPRTTVEPAVVATMSREQILASRNVVGIYTPQSPFNLADVHAVEAAVERKVNIVGYFQSWKNAFRPDAVKAAWRHGAVPLVTWESRSVGGLGSAAEDPDFSLPVILSGRHDEYIRSWARGISELALPLILRLDHEMNAPWYPWAEVYVFGGTTVNGNNRGDYVRMWRHVHRIFEEEGANRHVIWLWSPNRVNAIPMQPPPAEFYPGDDVVDWIGMSGYYRFYDAAPTFDATYGATLPLLRAAAPTKPILLAEVGATEIGGNKAAWVRDLFQGLARNPDIIGFCWFNFTVTSTHENELYTNDWRIDSSPASVRIMREALATAGFGRPAG